MLLTIVSKNRNTRAWYINSGFKGNSAGIAASSVWIICLLQPTWKQNNINTRISNWNKIEHSHITGIFCFQILARDILMYIKILYLNIYTLQLNQPVLSTAESTLAICSNCWCPLQIIMTLFPGEYIMNRKFKI